jgi:hypothetical protein
LDFCGSDALRLRRKWRRMHLQHPPATTSRISGVSNTGVGFGWCVRRDWEDAVIRIRVPDITYLALRRLVAMGVLEELVAAASLGLENPSQRKLAREIEREHAQLAACQRGHRLDESATAAIYATTCHIPGGRKTLRCLLTGTPVVPLDCLRSTTAPRVCRLSSSRTTSHLTTATLLSAHCFDRL